jgi:hypothetical protein
MTKYCEKLMGCDSYFKFNSFNLGNFWGGNAVILVSLYVVGHIYARCVHI